jgi:hypothetical protein
MRRRTVTDLKAGVARADITPAACHGCWAARTGLAEGSTIRCALRRSCSTTAPRRSRSWRSTSSSPAPTSPPRCARVQELTGIPPHAVLVNAAHNHSAPASRGAASSGSRTRPFARYVELLPETIAGVVYAAWRSA